MRPIKFRAWLVDESRMYEWDEAMFSDTSPVTDYAGTFPSKNPNVVLEQFTGLFDAGNKEIYEGDIVRGSHRKDVIGEVIYKAPSFMMKAYTEYQGKKELRGIYSIDYFGALTRIGNIHQNGYLLKSEGGSKNGND